MRAEQARQELRQLLKTQKTVRVSRLKVLLQSINMPLRHVKSDPDEVAFLKKRIDDLQKEIKILRNKISRPRRA